MLTIFFKVNHFPMAFEIGRKDRMYMNVTRLHERLGIDVKSHSSVPYFVLTTYFD